MSEETEHPTLGDTKTSKALRIGASIAGAVPFAGATIQTVLTEAIPNVRAERVEAYIRQLQDQIDELKLKLALEKPEGLDLFEEGLWQSARAISDERKKYVAELVSKGLQQTDFEQQETRHFMRILEQLDDRQIVLLAQYHPANRPTVGNEQGTKFHTMNKEVLTPGAGDDFDDHKAHALSRRKSQLNQIMEGHLYSLGLLIEDEMKTSIEVPKRTRHFLISESGEAFLEYIGAIPTGGE